MFTRARWLGVGFGLGVGTSVVAARKAKRQVDRYRPDAVAQRAAEWFASSLSHLRDQLAAAVDDGRAAARARETELLGHVRITRPGGQGRAVPFGRGSPDR